MRLPRIGFANSHSEIEEIASTQSDQTSVEDDSDDSLGAALRDSAEVVAPEVVNYVVDSTWQFVPSWNHRVWELKPPGSVAPVVERGEGSIFSASGEDEHSVRHILMPRRIEDLQLLRSLDTKHLRVELWPQRSKQPRLHVRVLTDAISFSSDTLRQSRSAWLPPRRRWLLFFQTVLDLPSGVASCSFEWRWVSLNGTQLSPMPLRVLEVVCPLRPRGFLWRDRPNGSMGNTRRSRLLNYLRIVLLGILVGTCICQVVLLVICVAVITLQVVQQRTGRVARRG